MEENKDIKKLGTPIVKKTGKQWSNEFCLEFIDWEGWFSQKEFNEELITKWEFANRASQCVFSMKDKSRRAAQEFRNLLYNKNEKNN